jgi:hypothetical protein
MTSELSPLLLTVGGALLLWWAACVLSRTDDAPRCPQCGGELAAGVEPGLLFCLRCRRWRRAGSAGKPGGAKPGREKGGQPR